MMYEVCFLLLAVTIGVSGDCEVRIKEMRGEVNQVQADTEALRKELKKGPSFCHCRWRGMSYKVVSTKKTYGYHNPTPTYTDSVAYTGKANDKYIVRGVYITGSGVRGMGKDLTGGQIYECQLCY